MTNNSDSLCSIKDQDPNRLSRDLSFEISCWDSLNKGVAAKCKDHDCNLIHDSEDGLCLQLRNVWLGANLRVNALHGEEFGAEIRGAGQVQLKIDDSVLKGGFRYVDGQFKDDIAINRCYSARYNPKEELPLRAVLQFKGKYCPIAFHLFFSLGDEHEVGVIVDSCGTVSYVVTGIRFTHGGKNYLLYSYTDKAYKSNYIVIEALDSVSWWTFTEVSRRILNVVGFLTSHFMFGPFLIFSTKNQLKSELVGYENSLPPPCRSLYPMYRGGPYCHYASSGVQGASTDSVKGELPSRDKLRKESSPFKRQHVEKLMSLLDDKYFLYMFYTLVENAMVQHMRMASSRLIAYAVCLEIGGNWYKEQAASKEGGTNSDFLSAEVKEDFTARLLKVVDDLEGELGSSAQKGEDGNTANGRNEKFNTNLSDKFQIVKNRIKNELFRQTNAEKLASPFLKNRIELSAQDKKLLNGRNGILHGWDCIEAQFDPENPEPYIKKSEKICFEYYVLIWRLIMHVIGYNGV